MADEMTYEEFMKWVPEQMKENPEMYDTGFAKARAYRIKMREKTLKRKKIMLAAGKILLASTIICLIVRFLSKQLLY